MNVAGTFRFVKAGAFEREAESMWPVYLCSHSYGVPLGRGQPGIQSRFWALWTSLGALCSVLPSLMFRFCRDFISFCGRGRLLLRLSGARSSTLLKQFPSLPILKRSYCTSTPQRLPSSMSSLSCPVQSSRLFDIYLCEGAPPSSSIFPENDLSNLQCNLTAI
jgi:hypothetical protein